MIGNEKLRQLYAAMLQCRMRAGRAPLLDAQMRIDRGYAAAFGHEAVVAACTVDLRKQDVVVSHRPAALAKFLHDVHLRRKKRGNVCVAFSAPGDFCDDVWSEALSAAAAESLPILFVCDQLAAETGHVQSPGNGGSAADAKSKSARIRSRAAGARQRVPDYGFPRIPVDGHDVVAIYRVAHESLERARHGRGATLIECQPYRLDAPRQKRTIRAALRRAETDPIADPILFMERYLGQKGLFRDAWKKRLAAEFSRKLGAAPDAEKQA